MPLRGELNSVDLAHVFQMLILNQKAGTLEIVHEGISSQLYFCQSGVLVPFERDLLERRAVAALVRAGELTEEQVQRARANMEVLRRDLMATLVDMRSIADDVRRRAQRAQLEEDVYDLFFLRDATFEFRDGESPRGEGEVAEELALSPNGLIMEAARRVDEWEYIRELVPSGADIFELTGDVSTLDLKEYGRDASVIVEAIDGMRTVDELIEKTGVARFAVFRVIAGLLDRAIASSVTPDLVVVRARSCLEEGKVASARNLYEHAIAQGTDDLVVLMGAGQAYEMLGEPAKACERFLSAGRKAEEQGDLSIALELYLRIRELLPSQIGARERLFALRRVAQSHLSRRQYDPVREGWELAQILGQLERKEELVLVLGGLLDLAGEDPAQIEKIADLAIGMGNVAFAIDALFAAADRRNRSRDFNGALRCLKRAQGLDPARVNITNRIHAIGGAMERFRARRRSALRGLAMIAGSTLLSLAYARYSTAAMEEFGRYSLEDFLAADQFEAGREHFRLICRRFPLTVPFLLSLEKLRALDVAESNAGEVRRYREQMRAEERQHNLRQAELLRASALAARHSGDWGKAAELLQKARQLTGAEDLLDLDGALKEIEQYLAEARRLKSEAYFYRRAGRFAEAHARLLQLVETYPNTGVAREVELPVMIESEPRRARIILNGQPVTIGGDGFMVHAETPFVLDLPYGRLARVELEADGFARAMADVDPTVSDTVRLVLPSNVTSETIMPHRVIAPMATDGLAIVVPMERGRVGLLDAMSMSSYWTRELPDLADVTNTPALLGDEVVVPVSLNRLLWLSRSSGATLRHVDLPGRPVTSPVRAGSRIAVGYDGDGVAIVDGSARVATVTLPSARRCGPVALQDGRFAVGCTDGRVWLLGQDGSLTALVSGERAAAEVTALATVDERLLSADANGVLRIFDPRSGAVIATIPTSLGMAVDRIDVQDGIAVVQGAAGMAAVRLVDHAETGVVRGDLLLAAGGSTLIAAARHNGEILVLERAHLNAVAHYSAGAPIQQPGCVSGGRAFFVSADNKVVGIFCQRR